MDRFLAVCAVSLIKGTTVEVFLGGSGQERYAGRAQAVRKEATGTPWQRYGFEFLETTSDWVLKDQQDALTRFRIFLAPKGMVEPPRVLD
jgi:hypothetical protein